jgi:hypothetical protein
MSQIKRPSSDDSVLLIATAFGDHGDGVWLDTDADSCRRHKNRIDAAGKKHDSLATVSAKHRFKRERVSSAIMVAATMGSVSRRTLLFSDAISHTSETNCIGSEVCAAGHPPPLCGAPRILFTILFVAGAAALVVPELLSTQPQTTA